MIKRAGRIFGRIHRAAYPDSLGFGKNATRFSDPRRRIEANRFGVLYLGSTLKVCFLEAVLCDQRDGLVGEVDVDEAEITDRLYSEIAIGRALKLVDLRGDSPVKMGIPGDVVRGRTQTPARKWSLAVHDHPASVDGIVYPSRLSNEVDLAIYDRAVPKLVPHSTSPLNTAPDIGLLFTDFQVALVRSGEAGAMQGLWTVMDSTSKAGVVQAVAMPALMPTTFTLPVNAR